MRMRSLVFAAVLAVFAAPQAHAVGSHYFGLEGGASMPVGDFGDAAVTGLNLGASYTMMVTTFGVGAEIKYNSFGASDDLSAWAESQYGIGSEASMSTWQYDAFGIMTWPMPQVTPFVKAGAGFYSPNFKLESPAGDVESSDTHFGIVLGGGVNFSAPGPVSFGVGVNYHKFDSDAADDFVSASAKVMWKLKMGMMP